MGYTFRIGGMLISDASFDQTKLVLQSYCQSVYNQLDANIIVVEHIVRLRNAHPVTSRVADVLAGFATPPNIRLWRNCQRLILEMRQEIATGNLTNALRNLDRMYRLVKRLVDELHEYNGNITTGAERAVTSLEFIRDASAVTVATIAGLPVAAGGLAWGAGAVAVGGAGYVGVQTVAQQTSEVGFNLRDKIDWVGIRNDVIINAILNYFGTRLISKITNGLTIAPEIRRFATTTQRVLSNDVIKNAVANLLVNRGLGVVSVILRNTIDSFRDLPPAQRPTWDSFLDQLAQNFMVPTFFDLVTSEIGRRNPTAGHSSSVGHM